MTRIWITVFIVYCVWVILSRQIINAICVVKNRFLYKFNKYAYINIIMLGTVYNMEMNNSVKCVNKVII